MLECVFVGVTSHRISSADGVGNMTTQSTQPVTFNCFLSSQLETEQQVLLFSGGVDHQCECICTFWGKGGEANRSKEHSHWYRLWKEKDGCLTIDNILIYNGINQYFSHIYIWSGLAVHTIPKTNCIFRVGLMLNVSHLQCHANPALFESVTAAWERCASAEGEAWTAPLDF